MVLKAIFLQISDLHIGTIDPTNGNASLSYPLAKTAATFSRFDGLLGHHARGLEDLAAFYKNLRKRQPKGCEFRLIVTGDITRCGHADEFDIAEKFLFDEVEIRPHNAVGLKLGREEFIGIPGNHDHWGGANFPISANKSVYSSRRFDATPFNISINVGPRVVRFAAINSDADVSSVSTSRFLALGKFLSDLNSGALSFPPRPPEEIRICLIHHSWSATGNTLRMTKASKAAFTDFLRDNGFHAILTGHMHDFLMPSAANANSQPFKEFRCGSTTQHDMVPYNWTTLLGQRPKRSWPPNSLTVHTLDIDSGLTTWNAETFGRLPNGGFKSLGAQNSFSFVV